MQYTGNYTDIKESGLLEDINDSIGQRQKGKAGDIKSGAEREKEKPLKFSYKEAKEYEEIDEVIALLEEKVQELDKQLASAASDYVLLQQLMKDKEEAVCQLEDKMDRWIYLNELAEKIENNK
jgi:ATP-binding cassette subfamily F protein uup